MIIDPVMILVMISIQSVASANGTQIVNPMLWQGLQFVSGLARERVDLIALGGHLQHLGTEYRHITSICLAYPTALTSRLPS